MQQQTATLFVACLGIAGTLLGGISSQLIARSSQRRQWVADNRVKEAREILSVLSHASPIFAAWLQERAPPEGFELDHEAANRALDTFNTANEQLQRTISDRLFIARDVERAAVRDHWNMVMSTQTHKRNYAQQKEAVATYLQRLLK